MTIHPSLRRSLSILLIIGLLMATTAPATVFAGIVGTGDAIAEQSAKLDRDKLVEELTREDIRSELERLGVNPDEAVERVAAMTDEEVQELTAGLDQHPAGAGIGITTLLLIIIIILLLR